MHLALQVTAAKTSEFISRQHGTPEAPIWSVKPTVQNRYVITSICSASTATLPTTHTMPNTALCFGTVNRIPHTFRVRHSKCSAASSTQLPWKSDSTKIGKYRGYCHSHHLLQVWKRKPAPLQTGEEGARLEAIQSIQGHSQQRALLYCNKAIHAPFLVFALKGQVKDTHTLQSEKRPENAVNTCSDTHLHVLSRLTEHQGNNASGTQHQGMLSGGPPHGWEACGAAKTTCSEVCFLRVM